jgi:hypothetical protein
LGAFGLRWRMISTGKRVKVAPENQIRALYLEIDADTATLSLNEPIIPRMFASNKTGNFPLGIKMRLVPEISNLSNTESRIKVERQRSRQANFVANLMAATTWEISSLDFHDTELDDRSLRDLMMDIPSTDYPHLTLFHSIDPSFKGDGHVVSFLPQMEDEAGAMITGLLTYLLFNGENNDRIKKFFTVSAVGRSATSHCDIARQCVISEYDTLVDNLDNAIMDKDYVFDTIDADRQAEGRINNALCPLPCIGCLSALSRCWQYSAPCHASGAFGFRIIELLAVLIKI